jgi:hypothetical protein
VTAEEPRADAIADLIAAPVPDAVGSLEVRWIFPGRLEGPVAGWFGQFHSGTESRVDSYLLSPQLPGLSVKVRGGRALEVKVFRGSPGTLDLARRACGRMESWQKWSFPLSPLGGARLNGNSGNASGWRTVAKKRRIARISLGTGRIAAGSTIAGQVPGCDVELTEVRMCGRDWWSLGFEATGPADLLRSELEGTAALVFAEALPGGVELGPGESASYAQWLLTAECHE